MLVAALWGCGGSSLAPAPPPGPVTISDPGAYLAQSTAPDGSPATPLARAAPWAYERFDYGGYQAEQSYAGTAAGTYQTIWSYPPFGPFVVGNGDGGEVYSIVGNTVYITATQDGGQPGVLQQFGAGWPLFDTGVPPCSQGWEALGQTRACEATVTYPATGAPGNQITADTIVSEHGTGQVERMYMARGWGRLAWEAWNTAGCVAPVDPARAPAISYDAPPVLASSPAIKCDERLVTNVVAPPPVAGMSGVAFGWPP